MRELGQVLLVLGLVLVAAGVTLLVVGRVPWLGRLPGDVVIRRGPFTTFLPLATSLVLSVALTILVNLFWRR